jgi:hypothetical protein
MPKAPKPPKSPEPERVTATEVRSFAVGLYEEFLAQWARYHETTSQLFKLQAKLEVIEKNLCVTRDHLALTLADSEPSVPDEWKVMLGKVRFVGVRLADACVALLRERKKMTHTEMWNDLNNGAFRFRTTSPAREIHAALLRQQNVKRTPDGWLWIGSDDAQAQQEPLRLVEVNEKK